MHLLLSRKNKSYGLSKGVGDFIIKRNKIYRFNKGNEIIYYAGFQKNHKNHLEFFTNKKFSFNEVWNFLINSKSLYGNIMSSTWYHVGDSKGLELAKKLDLIKIF